MTSISHRFRFFTRSYFLLGHPIIYDDTRLQAYVPLPSSIGALSTLDLSCVVMLQLKRNICFVCALQLTIHPRHSPLFYFTIQSYFACFLFLSFVWSHWIHHYLYNYFATNIRSTKKERVDLMKTAQLFDFHCILNFQTI